MFISQGAKKAGLQKCHVKRLENTPYYQPSADTLKNRGDHLPVRVFIAIAFIVSLILTITQILNRNVASARGFAGNITRRFDVRDEIRGWILRNECSWIRRQTPPQILDDSS